MVGQNAAEFPVLRGFAAFLSFGRRGRPRRFDEAQAGFADEIGYHSL